MSVQNFPWNKVGSLAQRPRAGRTQQGYLFLDRDTGQGYFLSIHPTTRVRSWVSLGTSGAGLSNKYWVNASGSIPVVGYVLPQDGVDAAFADGHDPSNPATIFILPGTYLGTTTLKPGISLVGLGAGVNLETVDGSLLISGKTLIENLTIGSQLALGDLGTEGLTIYLRDVNVFGDAVLNGSDITFEHVGFDSHLDFNSNMTLEASDCSFGRGIQVNAPAIGTTVRINTSRIKDVCAFNCSGSVSINGTLFEKLGAITTLFQTDDSGLDIVLGAGNIASGWRSDETVVLLDGPGKVRLAASFPCDAPLKLLNGASSPFRYLNNQIYSSSGAPNPSAVFDIPAARDFWALSNNGADFIARLPPAANVPQGARCGLSNVSGSGLMTIRADGTDTINGQTEYLVPSPLRTATFQLIDTDWTPVATAPTMIVGTADLVNGEVIISNLTGVTSDSVAQGSVKVVSGTMGAVLRYVCGVNQLTISALTLAGGVVGTDQSTIQYTIIL